MRKIFLILAIILLHIEFSFATEVDSLLEKIEFSGFLRTRGWYLSSRIAVPDKFINTDSYKQVYYQDLFFRNRFNFKVMPELQIKSVFDISAYFGKSDFAMGAGGANLITRDIFAEFTFNSNSKISLGLLPFSQPEGFILARDATGFQYEHKFMEKKIQSYFKFIVAFDNADDNLGRSSNPPEYARDFIYITGIKINLLPNLITEFYYTGEADRFTNDDDGRIAYQNWFGLHNRYTLKEIFFKASGIFNFGTIDIRDSIDKSVFERTKTLSGLWEFEAGYNIRSDLSISVMSEGAGGDPDNSDAESSFQDIKASHGFSYIAVDNSGGIFLRGSGESSWYGLSGHGIKIAYTLFDSINIELKLLDFRTLKSVIWKNNKSSWFGDEFNLGAVYKYKEKLSLFINTGIFLPGTAYKGLKSVQHDPGSVILEIVIGANVNY